MNYDFDCPIDRHGTSCLKWDLHPNGIFPLWVADMDFLSPEPVIRALHERIDHGVFGYGLAPTALSETICDRLSRLYGWRICPEDIVYIPGVVPGFNLVCHALADDHGEVLVQTPVYPPILAAAANSGMRQRSMQLRERPGDADSIDIERFADIINDRCRVFILCNPQNPLGYVFSRRELEVMAEACLCHNSVICSDEIHCDLTFDGAQHIPIASLSPEIAQQTITLMAPSKTYNIAGLQCSLAIIQNEELRHRFCAAQAGLVPHVNVLGFTAALAGYREGDEWLQQVMAYLQSNRDIVTNYVNTQLPGIRVDSPQATYLAWLDCRQANLPDGPCRFFLDHAGVALNDGATFGPGGEGFARLNFGCRREMLSEALDRMRLALETHL